jgi:hypothetical protein
MKTLTKINTKVDGNKVTITGELIDVNFPVVVAQRQTIGHRVLTNPHRPRMCRATNHAFMVERHGADGFAIPVDEMVQIALAVDPKLSDPPVIGKHPTAADLILECKTESTASQKYQVSDDNKNWSDVALDKNGKFTPETGKYYHCVVSNLSGETPSNSFKVPPAPPEAAPVTN